MPAPAWFGQAGAGEKENKVSSFACPAPPHGRGSAPLQCSKTGVASAAPPLYCCLGLGQRGTGCFCPLLLKNAPKNPLELCGSQGGNLDLQPQGVSQPCCILLLLQEGVYFASGMEKVFILHRVRGSIAQQPCQHPALPCSQVCCKAPHSRAASCGDPSSLTALEPWLIHMVELIALPSSPPALCVQLINKRGKRETCRCFASFSFCAGPA